MNTKRCIKLKFDLSNYKDYIESHEPVTVRSGQGYITICKFCKNPIATPTGTLDFRFGCIIQQL